MSWANKLASLVGMLMIGDALAYMVSPERHIEAWRSYARRRPRYDRMLDWAEDHQTSCRAMSFIEVLAGAALIRRIESKT